MKIVNYEFKAIARDPWQLEQKLLGLNPDYRGEDHQVDTYFNVPEGRLKLREGNIENTLIYYLRPDIAGAKQSNILLYRCGPDKSLKDILVAALGVKVRVDKIRKIYFIDNVKFHFDNVSGLGTFVEVEAIDADGNIGLEKLREQCSRYSSFFSIDSSDYIDRSYSDLMILQPPR
jgi:adenylate cyclase, class 2